MGKSESESAFMMYLSHVAARMVFRSDGSLTWFGWICLAGGLIFACALCVSFGGCCNIAERDGKHSFATPPYYATCTVAGCIAIPFKDKPAGPEGGIAQAYCTLLLPALVVDLPFEAVADTVMLPWDLWKGPKKK